MKQQIINKLKSYSFWMSLSGALTLVVQAIARACGCSFDEVVIDDIITSIAGVLVVFGVISTPTPGGSVKVDSILGEDTEEKSTEEKTDSDKEQD